MGTTALQDGAGEASVQVTGPVARSINWGKLTLERRLALQVHYCDLLIHMYILYCALQCNTLHCFLQARMNQQMQEESG